MTMNKELEDAIKDAIELSKLLKDFEKLKYPSFGFGSVMFYRLTGTDNKWEAVLRNPTDWKNIPTNEFIGNTPLEAVRKLHEFCINNNYIKL